MSIETTGKVSQAISPPSDVHNTLVRGLVPEMLLHIGTFLSVIDLLQKKTVSRHFLYTLLPQKKEPAPEEKPALLERRKHLAESFRATYTKEIQKKHDTVRCILQRCLAPPTSLEHSVMVSGFFEAAQNLVVEEILTVQKVFEQMEKIVTGLETQRIDGKEPSLAALMHLRLAQAWSVCPLENRFPWQQYLPHFSREDILSHWITPQHLASLSSYRWNEEEMRQRNLEENRFWTAEEVRGLAAFQLRVIDERSYTWEQVKEKWFTQAHVEVLISPYNVFGFSASVLAGRSEMEVLGRLLKVYQEAVPIHQISPAVWRKAATRVLNEEEYRGHNAGSHLYIAACHSPYVFKKLLDVCAFSNEEELLEEELLEALQRPQDAHGKYAPLAALLSRKIRGMRGPLSSQFVRNDLDTLLDIQACFSPKSWEKVLLTPILFAEELLLKKNLLSSYSGSINTCSPLTYVITEGEFLQLECLLRKFESMEEKTRLLEACVKECWNIPDPLPPETAMRFFLEALGTTDMLCFVLPFFMQPEAGEEAVEQVLNTCPRLPHTEVVEKLTALARPFLAPEEKPEAIPMEEVTAVFPESHAPNPTGFFNAPPPKQNNAKEEEGATLPRPSKKQKLDTEEPGTFSQPSYAALI